ncbi:MAG: RNA methyltransferase [Clostridia bacterium]|nr:RNA methyltransferase [Clostridia bacterium]
MDWIRIESRQNAVVKLAASLADKKARDREGLFLAEGTTLLFDLCEKNVFPRKVLLSDRAGHLAPKVEALLRGQTCSLYRLAPAAFEKVTTEKGSEGIVSLFSVQEVLAARKPQRFCRLVAMENLQDPGNVGTILRTAAALGFDVAFLTGCADVFGPKAIRAGMGAVASIPVQLFCSTDEMMDRLDSLGVHTVAACLHRDAVSIRQANLREPCCVLIGNEGKGLTPTAVARAGEKSIIPIGNMESLNAASAASIFLWEIARGGGNSDE